MKTFSLKNITATFILSVMMILAMTVCANATEISPSQTELKVEDNAQEVSFDLILDTDDPYAGAEFALQTSQDDIEFKSIAWSDATKDLQHVQTEKNGTLYFGYFDGKNLDAGKTTVGTVTYTVAANAGEIRLTSSNIVTLKDDKTTSSNKETEGFTVTLQRVDSDAVASTKAALEALPAGGAVTLADQQAVARALEAYNALTEEQKALIDPALVQKMNDASAAITKLQKKQAASKSAAKNTKKASKASASKIALQKKQAAYNSAVKKAKKTKVTGLKVKAKKKRKAVVRWKKAAGVTGYKIQYSTSKKFKKGTRTRTIKKAKAKKATVKKLKAKKIYYFRIAAYTNVKNPLTGKVTTVQGPWSKAKRVKVKK